MPYEQRYVPAPTDMSLAVEDDLPREFQERKLSIGGVLEADARNPYRVMYFCRKCEGWIEGRPNAYREDTMAPLSGRRGTAYHCRRCGTEIAFSGMVS
jgi:ribosomal protein L40E